MRLGIDIGGTKTEVVAFDDDDNVLASRVAASGHGNIAVVEVAARLTDAVLGDAERLTDRSAVRAVGACMPGLVEPETGWVRDAVNLDVTKLDLGGDMGRALGHPVSVENDVKAAALGVSRLRPGRTGRLGYLNVGTGLAAAVVEPSGLVLRGIDGVAGEIGHLPVGGDVPCGCGQVGCLETVASGLALARLWPQPATGPSRPAATQPDPFAAARSGDAAAAVAVDTVVRGLGLAVQLLALAAGVETVVIGGGVTSLGPPLLTGVVDDLRRRATTSRLLAGLRLDRRVDLVEPGRPVAALGAAHLPWPGPAAVGEPRPSASPDQD